jgi:hypothetical protein
MNRPEALIRLLPSCLQWSPDGEVRVVGRRIGLFDIVKARRVLGTSPAMIAKEFELAPALIDDVLAFAEDYRAEVDPYVADYQATLDRQEAAAEPSPAQIRIRRLMAEQAGQRSKRKTRRLSPRSSPHIYCEEEPPQACS